MDHERPTPDDFKSVKTSGEFDILYTRWLDHYSMTEFETDEEFEECGGHSNVRELFYQFIEENDLGYLLEKF